MKTYKQFFEADSEDYVVPKDDDDEAKDIKPRSKGERKFKDDHKIDKKKHPTADDSVHTGDIKKVKKEEVKLDEDFSVEVPKQKIGGKTYGGGATVIVKAKTASQAIKMVAKRLGVDVNLLKTGKVVKEEDEVIDNDDDEEEDDDDEEEDDEEIHEDVLASLEDIAKKHQAKPVKFSNKKSITVDAQTANAMVNMFKKLNDQNKKKMRPFIDKSPENFMKLLDLAFGGGKK